MAGKDNTIRNRIVVEGEAEYKKALAEVNRSLRESRSAVKAAAAEFEAADGSMDAMRRQSDALERVLRDQEAALSLMRGQLEKVETAYGENSREATELRTKINNMRAEIAKSGGELRDFRTRMDQTADAMQDAGTAGDRLQGDLSGAERAFAGLGGSAEDAAGKTDGLIGKLSELTGVDLSQVAGVIGGLGAGLQAGEAVVGAAMAGVRSSVEQTQARGQIAAYTGTTGAQLDALEDVAGAVYKEGFGDSLKEAAQGVATVHSYTGAVEGDLQRSTEIAFRLDDVFGMDIPESARTAAQMMTVFGGSAEDAYALIVAGAQEGANKNDNLLDTLNEYAPYYAQAGKSAEEFMGTLTSGAQHGVYDIDKIGDAMKVFTESMMGGGEDVTKALKELGLETADLPRKFAEGGETASAAFDLTIDRLKAVQDPLLQAQLGAVLFGDTWTDTGGAVLEIFDGIGSGAVDAAGALDTLNETRTKDLDVALDRVERRVETRMGEIMEPVAEAGTDALNVLADNIDESGGKILAGLGETYAQANRQMAESAAQAYEGAAQDYDKWAADFATKVASGEWLDELAAQREKAQEETALAAEAAEAASEGLYEELAALDAQISEAWASGDYEKYWSLQAQRELLMDAITQTKKEAAESVTEAGTEMATALEDTAPQAMTAGDNVGSAAVLGAEAGLNEMGEAGKNAADSTVSGLRSGISGAYSAGYATGSAYARGYKASLKIASPSRVMQDMAEYTTDPLFDRFEEDRARLQAASAALGEAVAVGFTESPSGGYGGAQGGYGGAGGMLTAEAIGQAAAQAMVGMGVYLGAERVGEVIEAPVSRAQTSRALGTIRGQGAARRRL